MVRYRRNRSERGISQECPGYRFAHPGYAAELPKGVRVPARSDRSFSRRCRTTNETNITNVRRTTKRASLVLDLRPRAKRILLSIITAPPNNNKSKIAASRISGTISASLVVEAGGRLIIRASNMRCTAKPPRKLSGRTDQPPRRPVTTSTSRIISASHTKPNSPPVTKTSTYMSHARRALTSSPSIHDSR